MNPYTDNPELDAVVRERMMTLPAGLKRVFDDPASSIYIESFGASAGLTPEQTQQLEHEVMLLMLGFTPLDDFSFVLMTELDMSPRQAFAVEHWVTTVFLKDVIGLIGHTNAEESPVRGSMEPIPAAAIPPEQPISGALVSAQPYVSPVPATLVSPAPQPVSAAPVQLPVASVPEPQQQVVYSPPASVAPAPSPQEVIPAPISETPAPVASSAPPAIPAYAPPVAPAPVAAPIPTAVPTPAATPSIPVAQVQAPPVPLPIQPIAIPPTPAMPPVRIPPPVPLQPIAAIPVPPQKPTLNPIMPPVPRISSAPTTVDLNKQVPKPRTIFEDIAAAHGAAISPDGVARYDKPLTPTPAYGV